MATQRTRVVPSLVLSATFVGVIPACALGACGGTEVGDGGSDAKSEVILGVAAVAYCCFDAMGVADVAFIPDSPLDVASDAPSDSAKDAPEGG